MTFHKQALFAKEELQPRNRRDNLFGQDFGRLTMLSYFEAVYLVRGVFKNEKYQFFDEKFIDKTWTTVDEKYDKFITLEAYRDESTVHQFIFTLDKTTFGTAKGFIPALSDVEGVYPFIAQGYNIRYDEDYFEETGKLIFSEPTFDIHWNRRESKGRREFLGGIGYDKTKELVNQHSVIAYIIEQFDYENQKRLSFTNYIRRMEEE